MDQDLDVLRLRHLVMRADSFHDLSAVNEAERQAKASAKALKTKGLQESE